MKNFERTYYNEELGDIDRDVSEYWPTLNENECDGVQVTIAPFSECKTTEPKLASVEDIENYLSGEIDIQVDITNVDEVLTGLNIIRKYFEPSKCVAIAAANETMYSVSPDEIVEAGLTIEDLAKLASLNWMISDDSLAVFV